MNNAIFVELAVSTFCGVKSTRALNSLLNFNRFSFA